MVYTVYTGELRHERQANIANVLAAYIIHMQSINGE